MQVLGIEVPPDLLARWPGWFAPAVQPFLVADGTAADPTAADPTQPDPTQPDPTQPDPTQPDPTQPDPTQPDPTQPDPAQPDRPLSAEVRDTFHLYAVPAGLSCVWLTESDFAGLPMSDRVALVRARRAAEPLLAPSVRSWPDLGDRAREQADGHRFLWWPSLLAGHEDEVLTGYIEDGRRPSRHRDVGERTWRSAARVLPGARDLAGIFPTASGPNCFGTVLAAAGVVGADSVWMQREPFETWLSETTRAGGEDGDLGTVLVWRSPDGLVQHAAVTIGDGWALHKPSQGWMSPTKVLAVADVKRSARGVGRRLQRYTIGR